MKTSLLEKMGYLLVFALALSIVISSGCVKPNTPPVISGFNVGPGCPAPSSEIDITCIASDANNDSLSYRWSATKGTFTSTGQFATWLAPDVPGSYTVSVVVIDGRGGEATDELVVNVRNNDVPIIAEITAEPATLLSGDTATIHCLASDLDGDELSYEWTAERGNIMGEGAQVSWVAPPVGGAYTVTVRVTDTCGAEAGKKIEIRVAGKPCCPT